MSEEGRARRTWRGEAFLFIYLFVVGKDFGREEKHDTHLFLIFFLLSEGSGREGKEDGHGKEIYQFLLTGLPVKKEHWMFT